MKLLYVTNGINGPGGLERVLSVKASYLAEEYNYSVTILGLNDGNEDPFFGFSSKIDFVSFDLIDSRYPFAYLKQYRKGLQKVVDQIQPDVISICDNGIKAFLAPLFLKTKAKIIYERHNSRKAQQKANKKSRFWSWMKMKLEHPMMSLLARNFKAFVLLTNDHRLEWPRMKNIKVIANPLSFLPKKKASLTSRVILCVGRISYQKGQDLLLQAWERLSPSYPDWELHLYGEENLEFLNTRQLPKGVRHFKSEKSIEQVYQETAVYVMSSRYEGFGMVLTEAMSSGLPCVSFDCPCGPADVINHNVDGFLVEDGNVRSLAQHLNILMSKPTLRKEMGAKAQENVKRFSIEIIAEQWDQLFRSLCR